MLDACTAKATKEGREEKKQGTKWGSSERRVVLCGGSMTAYLSKQQSCFADLDSRGGCGEAPCSCGWHHQHHSDHHQHHHHHHHQAHRYHYGLVPGGATLPRKGGRMAAWHAESSSCRSPGRLSAIRAKGGSCDLWPSECGYLPPYQVKALCYWTVLPTGCVKDQRVVGQICTLICGICCVDGQLSELRYRRFCCHASFIKNLIPASQCCPPLI